MRLVFALALTLIVSGCGDDVKEPPPPQSRQGATTRTVAEIISNLTLPAKLDTLKGDRATNPRLRKACYWLMQSDNPEEVIESAIANTPRGNLTKDSLRRNLKILAALGCFTEENMTRLRSGKSPVITRGPYAGEKAEVDHIAPVAKAPAFRNWIGNLEFMPQTLNRAKGDRLTERAASHLQKLNLARELSP